MIGACVPHLLFGHLLVIFQAIRVGIADCQVAGGVFVEQGVIKEDLHIRNQRMIGNQGDFAQLLCAVVGIQQSLEHLVSRFSGIIGHDAFFKGEGELVNDIAVII